MERTDLDLYQMAVIKIQGAQNKTMNPTRDAFDVDGKERDNTDSPEEISFPYKLREIKLYLARHKINYQTRYHKIVNDTLAASDKKLRELHTTKLCHRPSSYPRQTIKQSQKALPGLVH
jgi:hypothetical protein